MASCERAVTVTTWPWSRGARRAPGTGSRGSRHRGRRLLAACAALLWAGVAAAAPAAAVRVVLATTLGEITLELDAGKAPLSVANFLDYVDRGHYDGLIFHRVIPGFMVQAGGYDRNMQQREAGAPIRNESGNGLLNVRGAVAMARLPEPDSARAQFFINVVDNARLDTLRYAVFGSVVDGMDVVDAIAATPTASRDGLDDVPVTAIVIERATRAAAPAPGTPAPAAAPATPAPATR
jgi:peptidyl-prolyl cis-trans isomerase A (cyclophilin A)